MAFRRRKPADHAGDFHQHFEPIGLCVAFTHRSTYALVGIRASDRVSRFSVGLLTVISGTNHEPARECPSRDVNLWYAMFCTGIR